MRVWNKISILTNCLLAALVIWLAHRVTLQEGIGASEAAKADRSSPPFAKDHEPQILSSEIGANRRGSVSFRWSQLESTDYRTYVANLRRIGCPEQTLGDIITADIDAGCYGPRRQNLEEKWKASGGIGAQETLESGLQALRREEAVVIAAILGREQPAMQVGPDSSPDSSSTPTQRTRRDRFEAWRNQFPDTNASVPLAFRNVDLTTLSTNAAEIEVINDVRQRFQEEMGASNQDPSDPAYLARWQMAQREADDMLRGMLGSQRFFEYQMELESQSQSSFVR